MVDDRFCWSIDFWNSCISLLLPPDVKNEYKAENAEPETDLEIWWEWTLKSKVYFTKVADTKHWPLRASVNIADLFVFQWL